MYICSDRNLEMGDKSSGYWEACFQLREPCPKFLQPMVDKVSTVELHAYLALEVRRLMFRDAFLVVVYLVHHRGGGGGGGGNGQNEVNTCMENKSGPGNEVTFAESCGRASE